MEAYLELNNLGHLLCHLPRIFGFAAGGGATE